MELKQLEQELERLIIETERVRQQIQDIRLLTILQETLYGDQATTSTRGPPGPPETPASGRELPNSAVAFTPNFVTSNQPAFATNSAIGDLVTFESEVTPTGSDLLSDNSGLDKEEGTLITREVQPSSEGEEGLGGFRINQPVEYLTRGQITPSTGVIRRFTGSKVVIERDRQEGDTEDTPKHVYRSPHNVQLRY